MAGLPTPDTFRTSFERRDAVVRVFVAMSDTALQSGKIATDAAYTLAVAGRDEAERRLAARAQRGRRARTVGHLPDRRRPGRLPRRLRPGPPGRDRAVRPRRRRHDAGHPRRRAGRGRAPRRRVPCRSRRTGIGPATGHALPASGCRGARAAARGRRSARTPRRCCGSRRCSRRSAASCRRPACASAPPARRTTAGRSRPTREWGGGTTLPDDRDLRDAWPEGVTLPRAIVYNLACTTLGLPAVTSDLAVLDRRAAVLLERHVPGYREIIASELPLFVKEAARARVRPQARGNDRPALPARRRGAVGRRAHARRPGRARPACSPCSTCATSPRTPRAGTRPRSTRATPRARRN